MPTLNRLFEEEGQSPWLDNLSRSDLEDGTMDAVVTRGVRGVTANPTIIARAIESTDSYDRQFDRLIASGDSVEDAYWKLAITDVRGAIKVLRPTFDASAGEDGYVSIEVAPGCAGDTDATNKAARDLHDRIREPNLLVKIPATQAGVPAIKTMIGEGRNINVTLIFSLLRYAEVLEAYMSGLEALSQDVDDLSGVHSVASFFVSRVDTEVDRRLQEVGTPAALALRGRAAVAQAKLAYQLFLNAHTGARWQRLAGHRARVQRPLWASTSTKNPGYPDTLYVDELIGPNTINTLSESTMRVFEDHGTLRRTIDTDVGEAGEVMHALQAVGIDMDDVGHTLELEGIAAFQESFTHVLGTLEAKMSDDSGD
jgi:transaldolase